MPRSTAAETSLIQAPPDRVYAVIRDYREHHPRILPRKYFRNLTVTEGGIGAGTHASVEMRVLGVSRALHFVVSEPTPGRVLVEATPDGSTVTTFTVEPTPGGAATRLTFSTEFTTREGFSGAIERMTTTVMLRRIYRKEMQQLAEYIAGNEALA
ncbi:MAG TPA: SRPBCC family protein [Bacteroidota bacterium]|nr:SRPBCC family protein [Bacteroidota bacterium]